MMKREMMMKKKIAIFALAMILPLWAAARPDRDPVTAAMAGANLSGVLSPAWGARTNPAAIVFAPERFAAAAGWQDWMPRHDGGHAYSLAAAGAFGDRFGFGGALSRLSGEPYDVISAAGSPSGMFTPSEFDLSAGLGVRFAERWAVSASFRFLQSRLTDRYAAQVFGASVLATYRRSDFALSAGLTNLATQADGHPVLPAAVALAGAWTPAAAGRHAFLAELDAKAYLSGGFAASLGMQYAFDAMFFARAGYRFSNAVLDLPSHASAGVGVKFRGVALDLSCLFASPTLAGTLLVGLAYSF